MTARPRVFAVCLAVLATIALSGCASSGKNSAERTSSQPPLGFRSLPSFLPSSASPVDTVLTASAAHPQLAVQGVAVAVNLPGGHVLATVTGPKVPPFVSPPPEQVTATFTITLAEASGSVPVSPSAFTITDQLGRSFHPTLVRGEAAPPKSASDQTVTFELNAVMPTGEGRIYWAPNGGTPFVGWDFIVEND